MSKPLVSIIIPTYNRAHLIKETLNSIIAQTYINWECIIVDDGSTDDTKVIVEEYVKRDTRFLFYKRPDSKIKGANSCRNFGFEISSGAFVQWFDSDDVMLPSFVSSKVTAFEISIQFVICSGYSTNENLKVISSLSLEKGDDLFLEYTLWNKKIITNSVMFRKDFLLNKDLFSIFITRGQETELFSRLFFKIHNSSYKEIEDKLFYYRQHDDSKSKKNEKYVGHYYKSRTYICFEILKKAIILKNINLIQYYFENILNLFFTGIDNKDYSNSKDISIKLYRILKKINYFYAVKTYLLCVFFLLIKRSSYSVGKMMKNDIVPLKQ